jgi:hypothetical protein
MRIGSSLVSRHAPRSVPTRGGAALVVVALTLLVVVLVTIGLDLPPDPDPLLGPFRWEPLRGIA